MKIHNPNDLEFDPQTLRALARGDLDPVRQAVEDHKKSTGNSQISDKRERSSRSSKAKLPVGSDKMTGALAVATPLNEGRDKEKALKGLAQQSTELTESSYEERRDSYQALNQKNRQLVSIIRECEALEVVNYDLLALKHYPANDILAAAKRRRDLWLMCCLFCIGLVFIGWLGFMNAWVTGLFFGILVLLLALTLKPFRILFYQVPTLGVLKTIRKSMEFQALNHIKMLEGDNGLVYQCQRMQPYRSSLGEKRFLRLILLSKQRNLLKAMRTVAGIRMYLSYLLEAQQAFSLVKQEYMKTSTQLKREYADFTTENTH